jgi:transcriptional regulator GlxA family with amidase domain
MSFVDFLSHIRIKKAKKLLKETDSSIIDISVSVGFETDYIHTYI